MSQIKEGLLGQHLPLAVLKYDYEPAAPPIPESPLQRAMANAKMLRRAAKRTERLAGIYAAHAKQARRDARIFTMHAEQARHEALAFVAATSIEQVGAAQAAATARIAHYAFMQAQKTEQTLGAILAAAAGNCPKLLPMPA